MTRERLLNVGTASWAVALPILAVLYAMGAMPALARGAATDCGTACLAECGRAGYECEDYWDSGGASCEVTCSNGVTVELRCPKS